MGTTSAFRRMDSHPAADLGAIRVGRLPYHRACVHFSESAYSESA